MGDRIYFGMRPWRGWGFNWGAGGRVAVSDYFDDPSTANLEMFSCELVMAGHLGANVMRIPLDSDR